MAGRHTGLRDLRPLAVLPRRMPLLRFQRPFERRGRPRAVGATVSWSLGRGFGDLARPHFEHGSFGVDAGLAEDTDDRVGTSSDHPHRERDAPRRV